MLPSDPDTVSDPSPSEENALRDSAIVLLTLNVVLIIYLSYRLYKYFRYTPNSAFEKKNRHHRSFIYLLILVSLLLRGASQVFQMLGKHRHTVGLTILVITEALPTLLFVSIAGTFAYFWHKIYSSFCAEPHTQIGKKFKVFLVIFNVLLYLTFGTLATLNLTQTWQYNPNYIHSVFLGSLILSTILLLIHGSRLYKRTMEFIDYTRRNIKSASAEGFRRIYFILIVCCLLKCLKEVLTITFANTMGVRNLLRHLAESKDEYYIAGFVAYIVFFYVIGEYLLFFSLILLLESYANKAKLICGDDRETAAYLLEDNHGPSPLDISGDSKGRSRANSNSNSN